MHRDQMPCSHSRVTRSVESSLDVMSTCKVGRLEPDAQENFPSAKILEASLSKNMFRALLPCLQKLRASHEGQRFSEAASVLTFWEESLCSDLEHSNAIDASQKEAEALPF